jgi:N-dimethylarginine dimethylaminohydrolase
MKQAWNEYGELKLVGVRGAENSFRDRTRLDAEWQKLRFHQRPSLGVAIHEHQIFRAKLRSRGAELIELDDNDELTLDSIYTRDNIIVSPGGLILCNMGRASRTPEGPINAIAYVKHGFRVAGYIEAPGTLEGGDFIWLDEKSAAVALGPRTNQAGIEQLHDLLGRDVDLHVVPLPGVDHPDDVLHLMSIISPVDRDLAVVYRPMMPPAFSDWLIERGLAFVEVPEHEFLPMGCNVLALGPRRVLMLKNLPGTKAGLEAAGCYVETYTGIETSLKGEGGPTCLTRPLVRAR